MSQRQTFFRGGGGSGNTPPMNCKWSRDGDGDDEDGVDALLRSTKSSITSLPHTVSQAKEEIGKNEVFAMASQNIGD